MATTYVNPLIAISGDAPAALGAWQWYLNGLVMGAGTPYLVTNRDGFGSPEVRTYDSPRTLADGDWPGQDQYASRAVILNITIRGASVAATMASYNSFLAAWFNDPNTAYTNLWYQENTELPRRAIGHPRRIQADKSRLLSGTIQVVAEFYSPFANLFYANSTSTNYPSVVSGTGRSYPRSYPYTYSTVAAGGTAVEIVNLGSYAAYPVFTINNEGQNPRLYNDATGEMLGADLTVGAGQELTFDTWLRTVTLNGANQRSKLTVGSSWWRCASGSTPFRYLCASPNATPGVSNCVVTFASSDLG